MGTILLIAAWIIEFALAAFSIVTKSNQVKVRSITRIASLLAFVLLAFLPIIDWGYRYFALAALLLLLAIMGAKNMLLRRADTKRHKAIRVVLKAVGMTMLFYAVILPAILFPQTPATVGTTGEHLVLTKTVTYIDTNRIESYADTGQPRKLNVQMWYPDKVDRSEERRVGKQFI